jgi:hypothetical protein
MDNLVAEKFPKFGPVDLAVRVFGQSGATHPAGGNHTRVHSSPVPYANLRVQRLTTVLRHAGGAVTEILHGRAGSLDDLREALQPEPAGSACKYVYRVPPRGLGTEQGLEISHPLQDTRILQFQLKTSTTALG